MSMNFATAADMTGAALAPHRPRRASPLHRLRVAIALSLRREKRRRRRMASIEVLSRLDDHILKDIGFRRDELVGR